jgi:DNA polymerase-3 subunit alpha (Gram-positive type)
MQDLALKEGFTKILHSEIREGQAVEALFGNVQVQSINFYKKSKKMEIKIESDKLIPTQVLAEIEEKFAGYFNLNYVDIRIKYLISDPIEVILSSYWEDIVFYIGRKLATSRGLLSGCGWSLLKRNLSVQLKTRGADILKAQGCARFIEDIIEQAFSTRVKVEFIDCIIDEGYNTRYIEEKKAEEQRVLSNVIYMSSNDKGKSLGNNPKTGIASDQNKNETESVVILGKNFKDTLIKMKDISQDSGKVTIGGDILSVDYKEIRGERYICIFDITDGKALLQLNFL